MWQRVLRPLLQPGLAAVQIARRISRPAESRNRSCCISSRILRCIGPATRSRSRKQTSSAAAAGKLMGNNFEAAEISYGGTAAMDAVYMLGFSVAIRRARPSLETPDLLADLA